MYFRRKRVTCANCGKFYFVPYPPASKKDKPQKITRYAICPFCNEITKYIVLIPVAPR